MKKKCRTQKKDTQKKKNRKKKTGSSKYINKELYKSANGVGETERKH